MSDIVLVAIIAGFLSLAGVVCQAAVVYYVAKLTVKAEEIKKVGEAVHVLVNSNMGIQLKISAIALRRLAEISKSPKDKEAAKLAEAAFADHELKQAKVDASGGAHVS